MPPEKITDELRATAQKEGPGSPEANKLAELEALTGESVKDTPASDATIATDEASKEALKEIAGEELTLDKDTVEDTDETLSDTVAIPATGNKTIDDVAKLLLDKKVPNSGEIMAEFAEQGELSLSSQAALVDALGETVAQIALTHLNNEVTKLKEKGTQARQEVLEYANKKFDGADATLTWTQMRDFARSDDAGFEPADIKAMNTMLSAGGLQAKLVVDKIAQVYYASNGTTRPGDLLEGDAYNGAGNFKSLSRAEYVAQLREAVQKYGEHSPQVNELNRRREISRNRGQ